MKLMFKLKAFLFAGMFWVLCGVSFTSQAHLLNMTRVTLEQSSNDGLSLTIIVDLTRALGGGEAYYELSRLQDPLNQVAVNELAQKILSASNVTLNDEQLHWQFESISLPINNTKGDFVSGLSWPMTSFVFSSNMAQITADSKAVLQASFTAKFQFEEPIALSIQQPIKQRNLNRWLVRNQQSPSFDLNKQNNDTQSNADEGIWLAYIWQGIIHILPKGWDHALFVLGLFLGARKIRDLLVWITGFTFAHTITLGLASYGAIAIPASIIEPIIALSIAWIAIENLCLRSSTKGRLSGVWRLCVVIIFGLVHGLGFAVVLKELGFPEQGFIAALISFNIGVELAQIAIIAIAFMLLGKWYQGEYWRSRMVIPGSILIAILALVLMSSRML